MFWVVNGLSTEEPYKKLIRAGPAISYPITRNDVVAHCFSRVLYGSEKLCNDVSSADLEVVVLRVRWGTVVRSLNPTLQAHVMWQKGVAASLFCLNLFLPPHRSQGRPRIVVTGMVQARVGH